MSRVLFGVGAQGSLIATLQSALAANGFDPKGPDGLYGKDTASDTILAQTDGQPEAVVREAVIAP